MRLLYDRFTKERNGLAGVAFLRVGLALIMIASYLRYFPMRSILWGVDGQLDYADYRRVSVAEPFALYREISNAAGADALYFASLAIAILYALGFATRVTSWLFAITTYAGVERIAPDFDGGRTLLILLAFLLCFADTSRYLVLIRIPSFHRSENLHSIGTMLQNAICFLLNWQVCMVYCSAVFYKLGGSKWRDGTAMYYVLHSEHFAWSSTISHLIGSNAATVALLTYSTLAFQSAFPFLMWDRRLKPFLIAIGILLHVGIALTMGLLSFSLTMIVAEVALLADAELIAIARSIASLFPRFGRSTQPTTLISQRGTPKFII